MSKTEMISTTPVKNKSRKIKTKRNTVWISVTSVILFLITWELISYYKLINPLFISSPIKIVEAATTLFADPKYWQHLGVSAYEFSLGFILAMAIGIPLGIFAGWNRIFNSIISPFVSALYVTPKVALLPIIIIAFGIGVASKIVVVFLMAFFPIVMSAQKAMSTLDQNLIKAARSFTASEFQIFKTIALPSTVPFLLNGIRLGLGQGLIAIVVGEMYASTAGIGYHLTHAGQNLKTAEMFVGVVVIAVSGVILTGVIGLIEKRFSSWKPE
ncbi:ABC transporter permease [Cytobacillus sp. Sa5YUA1]|uniref:ABC transporter permease n=1 Tax=Cytobacillus stercorigallinarum TaxID=2762240 RepID=A0ABR8QM42_9BACI|nr:ABC transporter permease [Cytobacillus stercorigallinarum]MBD7936537.1 ABC transporter permease [Cytobacillus stercorigallinarum]